MKLYANGILLNAAAQSVTLEKSRGDAAATLTAVLLTAAADRYFPKESLALGDAVRLLGDAGEEVFLGAVQAVSRNVETVTLIACDRGLYLTANELSGVFAGSPEGICRAVAMRLSLPVGTLEVPAGWKRLVAGAGVRAFDILRQAVGEEREISIQNDALTVTKAGQERFVIAEETVLASRGTADARQMVNRCAVIDRRGAAAATAQNTTDLARFGLRQRVLGQKADYRTVDVAPANRPPALCPGCPHRGFFYTLSKNKNYVVTGDIGCYTLGCAAPLNCMDSVVCMGAGFSAGMGIAKSFEKEGVTGKVVFGVVGDSTFFHSGMTGAAEIVYNKGRMIPCVLDNRITGMTGHQDNPGTGYTLQGDPTALLSVEKILTALGFAPVLTVDPQDLKAMKAAVDQAVAALDAGQQPAIVTRRPCLLIKRDKFRKGMCRVNADKCRSCRSCLKVGCPAISLENGKAVIDRTQCVGCTVCAQVCPFDAIEKEEK